MQKRKNFNLKGISHIFVIVQQHIKDNILLKITDINNIIYIKYYMKNFLKN